MIEHSYTWQKLLEHWWHGERKGCACSHPWRFDCARERDRRAGYMPMMIDECRCGCHCGVDPGEESP